VKKLINNLIAAVLFLSAVLLVLPGSANAQNREYHRERVKDRRERIVRRNVEYREVIVKKRHYFYREGYYYNRGPKGYVKIVAPIGARITLLPHGYKIVRFHRVKYYVFGDVYYRFYPREKVYVVVKAPL
jgi:hypothetical protein